MAYNQFGINGSLHQPTVHTSVENRKKIFDIIIRSDKLVVSMYSGVER